MAEKEPSKLKEYAKIAYGKCKRAWRKANNSSKDLKLSDYRALCIPRNRHQESPTQKTLFYKERTILSAEEYVAIHSNPPLALLTQNDQNIFIEVSKNHENKVDFFQFGEKLIPTEESSDEAMKHYKQQSVFQKYKDLEEPSLNHSSSEKDEELLDRESSKIEEEAKEREKDLEGEYSMLVHKMNELSKEYDAERQIQEDRNRCYDLITEAGYCQNFGEMVNRLGIEQQNRNRGKDSDDPSSTKEESTMNKVPAPLADKKVLPVNVH